jgi:spermidine/putrescine-binding protein
MFANLFRSTGCIAAIAIVLTVLAPLPVSPAATFVVPDVAKAKAEGLVVFYTSVDVTVAERLARDFQSKYGIKVQVERTGSERVFQRIGQEMGSNLHVVDVVNTSDAANFLVWKNSVVRDVARDALADRLQPVAGEARGRAQDVGRSAQTAMEREARQGAPRI